MTRSQPIPGSSECLLTIDSAGFLGEARRWIAWAVVVWALAFCVLCGNRVIADDKAPLDAIRNGYVRNRELFSQLYCEFELIEGFASTIDDAKREKLDKISIRHGIWVTDGKKLRYELDCPCERSKIDIETALKNASAAELASRLIMASADCDSTKILSDGNIDLTYTNEVNNATVRHTTGTRIMNLTPWTSGFMGNNETRDIAAVIDRKIAGDTFCRLLPKQGSESLLVLENGRDEPKQDRYLKQWSIDPDRGFLPVTIRFSELDGAPCKIAEVVEIKQFANGGYFPMKSVVVRDMDLAPPFKCQVFRVVKLSLDKLEDRDFQVSFARPTTIVNPSDLRSVFKDKEVKTVSLNDLPTLIERCEKALDARLKRQQGRQKAN